MGLTVGQIVGWITAGLAVLSVIIEFNKKIKFNPLSTALKWIGKRTNGELEEKIDNMEKKMDSLEGSVADLERNDIIDCRREILQFADELRRGVKHSQETFDQILSDIDAYDRYCVAHKDFQNNKTLAAKKKILEVYDKRLDDNDFL